MIEIFEPLSIVMVANFIVVIFQIQLPGTIDGWILITTGSTNPLTSGRSRWFSRRWTKCYWVNMCNLCY